jgi:hypothetical protein
MVPLAARNAGQDSQRGQCDAMARMGPGIPGRRPKYEQDFGELALRFLLAVDVEGFSRLHAAEQARVHDELEQAITGATANAGLNRERWYRQPRGDGELAVLPEAVDGLSLVADYPRELAATVAALNHGRKSGPRLRVRMAIHHGAVAPGLFGPIGAAPVAITRLVDAETVKQQLRRRGDLDIALIVSATVFNEVIQTRLRDLDPETFRRTVIRAKGITYIGYLYQDDFIARDHAVPTLRQSATA